MRTNIYAKRDHEALGQHYLHHIDRMTVEGLHSKSAIAGELAHRDDKIARLESELARAIIAAHEAQRPAYQEPTEEMLRAGCLSQQATPEYDNYEDWSNSHSGGTVERIRGYMRKDYLAMVAAAPQPAVEPAVELVLEQALQAMAPMRGLIIFDQAMQAVQDLLERSHKNESLPTTKPMTQIEIDTMIDNFPAHSWDTDELIVRAVERHHGIGKA